MSDTSAFLGGAAFAGLAALILLKGGISIGAPGVTPSVQTLQPLPTVTASPLVQPPSPSPASTSFDAEKHKYEVEQLKAQVEQEKVRTEQLKAQIQSQQALIDTLTKNNAAAAATVAKQQALAPTPEQPNSTLLTGLLWALGGMILTFGGGIALVGMFVLFSRQQRPNRTVEVIHTDDYPMTYVPTRRRAQMLPAKRTLRRVSPMDEQ